MVMVEAVVAYCITGKYTAGFVGQSVIFASLVLRTEYNAVQPSAPL
jgi:hypothetical protein